MKRLSPLDHWRMLEVLAHEACFGFWPDEARGLWPENERPTSLSDLLFKFAAIDPRFNEVGLVREQDLVTRWYGRPLWEFMGFGYCIKPDLRIEEDGVENKIRKNAYLAFINRDWPGNQVWDFVRKVAREVEGFYSEEPLADNLHRVSEHMPNPVREEMMVRTGGRFAAGPDHRRKPPIKPLTDAERVRFGFPKKK